MPRQDEKFQKEGQLQMFAKDPTELFVFHGWSLSKMFADVCWLSLLRYERIWIQSAFCGRYIHVDGPGTEISQTCRIWSIEDWMLKFIDIFGGAILY